MTLVIARALMSLAVCSLGESRREWALAMQAEFDAAVDDGRPLAFAIGCVIAASRDMPLHARGRFVIVNYALALGLIVPIAGLAFACVAGLLHSSLTEARFDPLLVRGSAQGLYMADAYAELLPSLSAVWVLLGVGHLRLAWFLLDRNWSSLFKTGALMTAAAATLVIFRSILFLDDSGSGFLLLLLAIELPAIYASARWHARLCAAVSGRVTS